MRWRYAIRRESGCRIDAATPGRRPRCAAGRRARMAMTIMPRMVRNARRRWRKAFCSAIFRKTAASLFIRHDQFRRCSTARLFQMHRTRCAARRRGCRGDHDDGFAQLAAEPVEQIDFAGGLRSRIAGGFVRHNRCRSVTMSRAIATRCCCHRSSLGRYGRHVPGPPSPSAALACSRSAADGASAAEAVRHFPAPSAPASRLQTGK